MSKCIYSNTYWNHKGKDEVLLESLNKLIPACGEVESPGDNPYLELFRQASNCYYDLYNNGLCNRANEFESIFGFNGVGELTRDVVKRTERRINQIMRNAAKEQRLETDNAR